MNAGVTPRNDQTGRSAVTGAISLTLDTPPMGYIALSFPVLTSAPGGIDFVATCFSTVSRPALTNVGPIPVRVVSNFCAEMDLSIPLVTEASTFEEWGAQSLHFPGLQTVQGTFTADRCLNPVQVTNFGALTTVVGDMDIRKDGAWSFAALTTAQGGLSIRGPLPTDPAPYDLIVESFDAPVLTTVGGALSFQRPRGALPLRRSPGPPAPGPRAPGDVRSARST